MGHTDSSGRPNGEGTSQHRVSPAFWARWLMTGMNKLMGKVKSECALGNSVKEERRPVKDKEVVKCAAIHYRKNTNMKYILKYLFFLSFISKTVR